MRARLAVVVLALVASSCGASALGRTVVECDLEPDGLSATSIITAQSVPSADFIPCITALRPGWNFHHVAPESGRSWFALDSDRVGFRFLQVTLTKTCDVGDAEPVASDHPGAEHFVDVIEARDQLEVYVIPIAERHRRYAHSVAASLAGTGVGGLHVVALVDESDAMASDRIATAIIGGLPVIVIDDAEVATGTISVRETDGDEESGVELEEYLDDIEDLADDPVYRATWFYVFGEDSCTRYDINAEGPGAAEIEADIRVALSFYDLTESKEIAIREGYGGAFE